MRWIREFSYEEARRFLFQNVEVWHGAIATLSSTVLFYIRLLSGKLKSVFHKPIARPEKARKPPMLRVASFEKRPTPIPKITNRNDSPNGIINANLGSSVSRDVFKNAKTRPTIPIEIISQIGNFTPNVMCPFIPVTDNVIPPKFGNPPGNAPDVTDALLITIHSAGSAHSINNIPTTKITIRLFLALFIFSVERGGLSRRGASLVVDSSAWFALQSFVFDLTVTINRTEIDSHDYSH